MEKPAIKVEEPEAATTVVQIMNIKQEPEVEFELILSSEEDSDVEIIDEVKIAEVVKKTPIKNNRISFSDIGLIPRNDQDQFKCKTCQESFGSKVLAEFHEKRAHGSGMQYKESEFKVRKPKQAITFQCDLCAKILASKFNLKRHLQLHYHKDEFSCIFCFKKFSALKYLKVHEEETHCKLN